MTHIKKEKDSGKLDFEHAIKDLTEIVDNIESGQTPLQSSIEQYEKGMELIKHCREILQTAEKKIEKIAQEKTKEAK
ncbi:MAG: exodeoxyribonuclease VII small subunit [Sedimentisphaerales bacterium]|nr:exodeoxyribonuclease VII small subunit [Sedimentisphaerales bacterium]